MVNTAGERSRSSDSKRRALAEGKSVRISYSPSIILLFSTFFNFSHCIFEFSKHHCMLETFLALFYFSQKSKNSSEHENPLKNKIEHLFEAKFGRHQSFKSF